jgi:hypothetical protein
MRGQVVNQGFTDYFASKTPSKFGSAFALQGTKILHLNVRPIEWARRIHQNRLVQIAREGAGTDAAHLRSFSPDRRYATLVATVLDTATILIDETLEMHERFLGKLFNKAQRKHLASFQGSGPQGRQKAPRGEPEVYRKHP